HAKPTQTVIVVIERAECPEAAEIEVREERRGIDPVRLQQGHAQIRRPDLERPCEAGATGTATDDDNAPCPRALRDRERTEACRCDRPGASTNDEIPP